MFNALKWTYIQHLLNLAYTVWLLHFLYKLFSHETLCLWILLPPRIVHLLCWWRNAVSFFFVINQIVVHFDVKGGQLVKTNTKILSLCFQKRNIIKRYLSIALPVNYCACLIMHSLFMFAMSVAEKFKWIYWFEMWYS